MTLFLSTGVPSSFTLPSMFTPPKKKISDSVPTSDYNSNCNDSNLSLEQDDKRTHNYSVLAIVLTAALLISTVEIIEETNGNLYCDKDWKLREATHIYNE